MILPTWNVVSPKACIVANFWLLIHQGPSSSISTGSMSQDVVQTEYYWLPAITGWGLPPITDMPLIASWLLCSPGENMCIIPCTVCRRQVIEEHPWDDQTLDDQTHPWMTLLWWSHPRVVTMWVRVSSILHRLVPVPNGPRSCGSSVGGRRWGGEGWRGAKTES